MIPAEDDGQRARPQDRPHGGVDPFQPPAGGQALDHGGVDFTLVLDDAADQFVDDFVNAWVKVAELDRFDVR